MSIQGKIRRELTIESVLERLDAIEVYAFYMPYKDWKLNQVCISPFPRNGILEKTPSFVIGNKYGGISHKDFSLNLGGDCFDFVGQLHGLDLNAVLRLISNDFGLDGEVPRETGNRPIKALNEKQTTNKCNTLLQVVTRKFTKEELAYWAAYYQDIEDLRKNDIYSIKTLYFNKKKFPIPENELRFAYMYENKYFKIYRPFANKKDKWFPNNVPNQTSWGVENLTKDKNTLICKSRKDYMVTRKVYENVCSVQKEGVDAFSAKFVEDINNNSKQVFYGGDSDVPGKKASYKITETFKWKHINPPDYLLNDCCKDWADWAKHTNLKELEDYFKIKGLIE